MAERLEQLVDGQGLVEKEFLAQYNPELYERLSLTVDTVIFSIDSQLQVENYRKLDEQELTVLLVKRKEHPFLNQWSLPGGFVRPDENLDEGAYRILKWKTGVEEIYMEQLSTYGDTNRDPRMRIVSCAYLSLIDRSQFTLNHSDAVSDSRWFTVKLKEAEGLLVLSNQDEFIELPFVIKTRKNGKIVKSIAKVTESESMLAFDHGTILIDALYRLRTQIIETDIVFNLMPEHFTLTVLQQIYEIILGKSLLAPAFRRKISDRVTATGEYTREKGHRPSQLFKYRQELIE